MNATQICTSNPTWLALSAMAMAQDRVKQSVLAGVRNPQLMAAALALFENRLHDAEPVLKAHLKQDPFDVAAIRMLAELAGRIGRFGDAENLLRRAIEIAPTFVAARSNLALLLYRQGRPEEAIRELDGILVTDPGDLRAANLKAAASSRVGDYAEAIALYDAILAAKDDNEKVWQSYGHVLRTVGRLEDGVSAYRRAIALRPQFGESWWSLANLKTVKFTGDDVAAMQGQLARTDISDDDRFHLDFALGKALEDGKDWEASFAHYDAGNRLRRAALDYFVEEQTAKVDAQIALLRGGLMENAGQGGCDAPDPIFILGMPRAGSTLIEQILASHSQIEGTQELPDIGMIASRLAAKMESGKELGLCAALSQLSVDDRQRLGAEYIERTRINRKTERALFVDKMPNNWQHVALIRLILPNAKIIDARRHPMDCCFSNYKQHFARGQSFSYDLGDLGRYYADYVRYMNAVDAAAPGKVHRVYHERLVDNPESEIRALLEYVDVPFEEGCLRFWENERAVQTPSAEQVRKPINRGGMDRWRHYELWLGPLKDALGEALTDYPA